MKNLAQEIRLSLADERGVLKNLKDWEDKGIELDCSFLMFVSC